MISEYEIIELHDVKNFLGLHMGPPSESMKKETKEKMIQYFSDEDFSGEYVDFSGNFEYKLVKNKHFNKVVTYGHLVTATIDFKEDIEKDRCADYCFLYLLFTYYPTLGEKLEEVIDKILNEKTYKTLPAYY